LTNIFLVRKGQLLTPPNEACILEGVTREAIIEIARSDGICVFETALTKHDLYIADECFLTGTAAEIVPVTKVDSRTIGDGTPGPITCDLLKRFRKLTRATEPDGKSPGPVERTTGSGRKAGKHI
jgi:branched-chain amino acid aminotransferase